LGGVRIPRRKKLSKMGGKRDKKCDEKSYIGRNKTRKQTRTQKIETLKLFSITKPFGYENMKGRDTNFVM